MKKINILCLCACFFFALPLFGQQISLSPVPQSALFGKKTFSRPVTYYIDSKKTADADAIGLLMQNVKTGKSGVKISIGKKGDANVRDIDAQIPNIKEGYFLRITPKRVIIAGSDDAGTFYGVQTFLQLTASARILPVTIKDYPNVAARGIVEGFYGNPYSFQDRLRLFAFMGHNKMNTYIYGPKDDPYHGFGTKWRDPYPAEQAMNMKKLIDAAHKNKVNFIWAVHPGNNISWDDKDGDDVVDDFKACVNKFRKMYELGVRSFAVFFDDIGGIGADAANQAKMMNYLNKNFVKQMPDVHSLILCPTQYNERRTKGDYLNILKTEMDSSVRIMWTGKSVIRQIDRETMDWINPRIGRKAYIWWNYPVTDYSVERLLMGAVDYNGQDIAPQLSGFVSNPMEYAEASKVALFSIADYCWNMGAYDARASWEKALKYLMPGTTGAFRVFCENNQALNPGEFIRNDNESASFKKIVAGFKADYGAQKPIAELIHQFENFRKASAALLASSDNIPMRDEIQPWVKVFDIMAQKGLAMTSMWRALVVKDSVAFINEYQKLALLDKEQADVSSRGYKGSRATAYPKPANLVVLPFLNWFKDTLIKTYKATYGYRADIFPRPIVPDGKYLIKYGGKYLSNLQNAAPENNRPVFISERDVNMPARQEWMITYNYATNRYKIVNMLDGKYLNENGEFGTGDYNPLRHNFLLYVEKDKLAIQNAGQGGHNFMGVAMDKVIGSAVKKLLPESFLFELESTMAKPVQ
ncbi:beta-N-acetylglucosaminidase domain-containing protein [Niabella hirudinis]|uniref:beta-N-acetylglucosaminidase domain-containing protein n=1 Tax=Niabella hirudinis TaxID=1285929 RepID=UPI003EBABBF4